ncbi:hypothetical protein [Planktotalea sp.]|uniref:hypothetical protein n=1 Tax=Planktotalea sp. TaxID=2029877 RepID=UPI00329A631B
MLGVVIWTAATENKAIIWCEDHGELAYLDQTPHKAVSAERFDEGDLIQFDLALMENVRLAQNPRRIAQHYCSDLDNVVKTAGQIKTLIEDDDQSVASPSMGNVVQFDDIVRSAPAKRRVGAAAK